MNGEGVPIPQPDEQPKLLEKIDENEPPRLVGMRAGRVISDYIEKGEFSNDASKALHLERVHMQNGMGEGQRGAIRAVYLLSVPQSQRIGKLQDVEYVYVIRGQRESSSDIKLLILKKGVNPYEEGADFEANSVSEGGELKLKALAVYEAIRTCGIALDDKFTVLRDPDPWKPYESEGAKYTHLIEELSYTGKLETSSPDRIQAQASEWEAANNEVAAGLRETFARERQEQERKAALRASESRKKEKRIAEAGRIIEGIAALDKVGKIIETRDVPLEKLKKALNKVLRQGEERDYGPMIGKVYGYITTPSGGHESVLKEKRVGMCDSRTAAIVVADRVIELIPCLENPPSTRMVDKTLKLSDGIEIPIQKAVKVDVDPDEIIVNAKKRDFLVREVTTSDNRKHLLVALKDSGIFLISPTSVMGECDVFIMSVKLDHMHGSNSLSTFSIIDTRLFRMVPENERRKRGKPFPSNELVRNGIETIGIRPPSLRLREEADYFVKKSEFDEVIIERFRRVLETFRVPLEQISNDITKPN